MQILLYEVKVVIPNRDTLCLRGWREGKAIFKES